MFPHWSEDEARNHALHVGRDNNTNSRRSVEYDNTGILGLTSLHTERNVFVTAPLSIEDVDEGKNVTGPMYEVYVGRQSVQKQRQCGQKGRRNKLPRLDVVDIEALQTF